MLRKRKQIKVCPLKHHCCIKLEWRHWDSSVSCALSPPPVYRQAWSVELLPTCHYILTTVDVPCPSNSLQKTWRLLYKSYWTILGTPGFVQHLIKITDVVSFQSFGSYLHINWSIWDVISMYFAGCCWREGRERSNWCTRTNGKRTFLQKRHNTFYAEVKSVLDNITTRATIF